MRTITGRATANGTDLGILTLKVAPLIGEPLPGGIGYQVGSTVEGLPPLPDGSELVIDDGEYLTTFANVSDGIASVGEDGWFERVVLASAV